MATRSFSSLAAVAVLAKHLEIVQRRMAALGPRRDVVRVHLGQLEVRPAQGTDSTPPSKPDMVMWFPRLLRLLDCHTPDKSIFHFPLVMFQEIRLP